MNCYHYDENGFYTFESIAFLDPMESIKQKNEVFSLPYRATFVQPPTEPERGLLKYVDYSDSWEVVEDFLDKYITNEITFEIKKNEIKKVPEGWRLSTPEEIEEFEKPPVLTVKDYESAAQDKIDKVAREKGYDNGYTCASYATDPYEKFRKDAVCFVEWRSKVWLFAQDLLNRWQKGEIEQISIETFVASLPKMVWWDEKSEE